MRNDLIIFHFENENGAPVYLSPALVATMGGELEQFMNYCAGLIHPEYQASVFISSISTGSLRLAWATFFTRIAENKDHIQTANELLELAEKVFKIFAWVTVSVSAAAHFSDFPSLEKLDADEPTMQAVAHDTTLNHIARQLALSTLQSGADKVKIEVVDFRSIEISLDNFRDPRHFGGQAPNIHDGLARSALGNLEFLNRSVTVQDGDKEKSLPVANFRPEIRSDTNPSVTQPLQPFLVLVDWHSKRQMGSAGSRVYVSSGSVTSLGNSKLKVVSKIHPDDRMVAGILNVSSIRVDE